MAEGRSNAAIAQRWSSPRRAIGKHTANIFVKLGLPPSDDDNRRVLAVLAYLNGSLSLRKGLVLAEVGEDGHDAAVRAVGVLEAELRRRCWRCASPPRRR